MIFTQYCFITCFCLGFFSLLLNMMVTIFIHCRHLIPYHHGACLIWEVGVACSSFLKEWKPLFAKVSHVLLHLFNMLLPTSIKKTSPIVCLIARMMGVFFSPFRCGVSQVSLNNFPHHLELKSVIWMMRRWYTHIFNAFCWIAAVMLGRSEVASTLCAMPPSASLDNGNGIFLPCAPV